MTDPTIGELDELILALKVELTVVEDWHSKPEWEERDRAIRRRIHDLGQQRDLMPDG